MKRTVLIFVVFLSFLSEAWAEIMVWINQCDNISLGVSLSAVDHITLSDDGKSVNMTLKNVGETYTYDYSSIRNVTFSEHQDAVTIVYDEVDAVVMNPYAFQGVTVEKQDADVVIKSVADEEISYQLTGSTTSGSFKIYSDKKFSLDLNGVSLANDDGAAINIQSGKKCTVLLNGTSSLADAADYTLVEGEDQKACFFSEGQIIFTGAGILEITGNYNHALASDDYIDIRNGIINIHKAANDGIHTNDYFLMSGGYLDINSVLGDGIDGGKGYVQIDGGTINLNVSDADTKGVKCDGTLTVNGGTVNVTMTANQGKAFKADGAMTVNGGTVTVNASGDAVVVDNDPSYCTIMKTDSHFVMNDGTLSFTHSGTGGKGISADSTITFNGGTIEITATGNGATYTASTGSDSYSATCITADGNIYLNGGTFNLLATGTGGKCIKTDMQLIAKPVEGSVLNVTAETKGSQIGSSSSGNGQPGRPGSPGGGGGWPGGWPGGGSSSSTSGSSPKVIKSTGNMTIDGGNFIIKSASEGGEGLESKATITISEGDFHFSTYDDCINAKTSLVITGGNIRAVSTGNDAIDSNGTMSLSGGVILASGTREPEEGIDVDQASKLSITGGTIINQKGQMLNLTTTQCKVPTVKYASSIQAGTLITVTDSSGNHILSFKAPQAMSQGCYITLPEFKTGNSYKLYTGGSVAGGTVFNEITMGGTYTAGTQVKSFTISSNLTNL